MTELVVQASHVAQGVAMLHEAMHALEAGVVHTPLGPVPLLALLLGIAGAPGFVPRRDARAPWWLPLALFLGVNLAGQFVTAVLLAVPPPFMEYNLLAPVFAVAWVAVCWTPGIGALVGSAPVQQIARVLFTAGATLGISAYGIDAAVASSHYLLSRSTTGAIVLGALVACAGNFVVIGAYLVWTARTETADKPLPIAMPPDLDLICLHKTFAGAVLYYVLTNPHKLWQPTFFALAQADAKLVLFAVLLVLEFFGPAPELPAPARNPAGKVKDD